jgi:hypothetical protein
MLTPGHRVQTLCGPWEFLDDWLGLSDPLGKGREEAVARAALYEEIRELLDAGAQLVEVLPEAEYAELHLVGARNIPLKQLDAETTAALDPSQPVVVYCHDAL